MSEPPQRSDDSTHLAPGRQVLLDLALKVQQGSTPQEVLATVASHLSEAVRFDVISLIAVDPGGETMTQAASFPPGFVPRQEPHSSRSIWAFDLIAAHPEGIESNAARVDLPLARTIAGMGIRRTFSMPLIVEGEPTGILNIGRFSTERFAPSEIEFIRLAGPLIAVSLENDRRLATARREAARNQLLNEIALLTRSGEAIDGVFGRVADVLGTAVENDFVALMAATENPAWFRMVGASPMLPGPKPPLYPAPALELDTLPTGYTEVDLEHPLTIAQGALWGSGFRRTAVITMRERDRVLGCLAVARRDDRTFSDDDRRFLEVLGVLLGQAIAVGLRLEEANAGVLRARLISEFAALVHAREDTGSLFNRLRDTLAQGFDFDYIVAGEREAFSDLYQVVAQEPRIDLGIPDRVTSREAGIDMLLTQNPMPAAVQYRMDRLQLNGAATVADHGLRRGMAMVLRFGTEDVGILIVARMAQERFLPAEEVFFQHVAGLYAQALGNRLLLERSDLATRRAELVNELAGLVNALLDEDVLFERITSALSRGLNHDFALLVTRHAFSDRYQVTGVSPQLELPIPAAATAAEAGIQDMLANPQSTTFQYRVDHQTTAAAARFAELGARRGMAEILSFGGEPVGALSIASRATPRYSAAEEEFFHQVAVLAAQAIGNHRLWRRSEAEATRARVLNEISVLLNAGEPVEAVFDRFESLLARGLGFDFCALTWKQPRGFSTLMRTPRLAGGRPYTVASLDQLGTNEVLALGVTTVQYETQLLASMDGPRRLAAIGIRRGASTVLRHGSETLGMLTFGRTDPSPFDESEITFIELAGTLVSQAISAQMRVERAQEDAARNELLNDIALLLNGGTGTGQAIASVADRLREHLGFDYISVHASLPRTEDLVELASVPHRLGLVPRVPRDHAGMALHNGVADRCRQGRPIDFEQSMQARLLHELGWGRVAIAALIMNDEFTGIVTAGRCADRDFTPDEMRFLETLSALLSQALSNERQIALAEEEASRNLLLYELAVMAHTGEPGRYMLSGVAERLARAVNCEFVGIAGHSYDDLMFQMEATYPAGGEIAGAWREPFDSPVARDLWEGGIRFGQASFNTISTARASKMIAAGFDQGGFLPLTDGEQMLGFIVVSRRSIEPFTAEQAKFIELVGALVSQALAGQRRLQRSQAEAAEQRLLARAASLAASATTTREVGHQLALALSSLIPEPSVTLGFILGDEAEYHLASGTSRRPMNRLVAVAANSGQLAFDTVSDEVRETLDPGLHALAITVAESGSAARPVLMVGSRAEGFAFQARELRLLRVLANIVAPGITNIRQSEQTGYQRALYELVFDSLSEAVLLLDHSLVASYANPAGERVVTEFAERWRALPLERRLDLLPEPARSAVANAVLNRTRGSGRAYLPLGDEPHWFDFEALPLDHPDFSVVVVASDVTAAVQQEDQARQQRDRMEQAARLAALGELIGGVAHELNNPLTAILGFAEMIASTDSNQEEAGIILKEARRARDIVRDLLFIARPARAERQPVQLGALVGHVERLRRAAWTGAGIEIAVHIDNDMPPVMGSEQQLTQVLLNLITNAEHALEGCPSPRLIIRAEARGGEAFLVVSDNGKGMDESVRNRVFEPFFTTKQGVGTGLGLPLSYSIVTAHNGRIDVQSVPGTGTTFTVRIPLAEKEKPVNETPRDLGPGMRGMRVLVIDDEPNLRKVLERIITHMGSHATAVSTAPEGLAIATAAHFDLIICDYRLGPETAEMVVEGVAQLAPHVLPRIVIATGATTDAGVVGITEKYGLRLMAKPYGLQDIQALLADFNPELALAS